MLKLETSLYFCSYFLQQTPEGVIERKYGYNCCIGSLNKMQ